MKILKAQRQTFCLFDTKNTQYIEPQQRTAFWQFNIIAALHHHHSETDYTFLQRIFGTTTHPIFTDFGESFFYVVMDTGNNK